MVCCCGATAQIEPKPHRFEVSTCRSHTTRHTHTHTHTHPAGLLWTSDRLVAEAAAYTTYKHKTGTSMPTAGFELSIPDLRLRPHCHWDRLLENLRTCITIREIFAQEVGVLNCSVLHYVPLILLIREDSPPASKWGEVVYSHCIIMPTVLVCRHVRIVAKSVYKLHHVRLFACISAAPTGRILTI
jgi:hypothetical protein